MMFRSIVLLNIMIVPECGETCHTHSKNIAALALHALSTTGRKIAGEAATTGAAGVVICSKGSSSR